MFRPSHYSRMNTADVEAAATKKGTSASAAPSPPYPGTSDPWGIMSTYATPAATKEGTSPAGKEFPVRTSTVSVAVPTRSPTWGLLGLIGAPVAMAVSYKRNQSIGWAVGAGFVWPAYLVYTLILDRK